MHITRDLNAESEYFTKAVDMRYAGMHKKGRSCTLNISIFVIVIKTYLPYVL